MDLWVGFVSGMLIGASIAMYALWATKKTRDFLSNIERDKILSGMSAERRDLVNQLEKKVNDDDEAWFDFVRCVSALDYGRRSRIAARDGRSGSDADSDFRERFHGRCGRLTSRAN